MTEVGGVNRDGANASSALILRRLGHPPFVVRQRIICGRWRALISQIRGGEFSIPDLHFDLSFEQIDELQRAIAETDKEFESQSELRAQQTETANAYAELSQSVAVSLTRLHMRWNAVRFDLSLDGSTRRVQLRAIRSKHLKVAARIKEVLAARKALSDIDLNELVFEKERYRWGARYKTDAEKFNWPPAVQYRRVIELYEKWLIEKEAVVIGYLKSCLDEE